MLNILIYILIIVFIIYIVQLLFSVIGFIVKVAVGIFALYLIARFIIIISEWLTKRVLTRRKDKEKKKETPRYLVEGWRNNDGNDISERSKKEEIIEEKEKYRTGSKIETEKVKKRMSDEEALNYARYCNAYMEHQEEMRRYETGVE